MLTNFIDIDQSVTDGPKLISPTFVTTGGDERAYVLPNVLTDIISVVFLESLAYR